MPSLTELAEEILANAKRLDAHLDSRGLPSTSFENDSLTDLPLDLGRTRDALVDSIQTLKRLALGPAGVYTEILFSVLHTETNSPRIPVFKPTANVLLLPKFTDVLSLRAIYTFDLAAHVPQDTPISYADLAQKASLPEGLVRRFLHHAMTNHIFTESPPGHVIHTASSRLLVQDPDALDAVGLITAEMAPPSTKAIQALQQFPNSEEPNETGFNIENQTPLPIFAFLAQHPERARRFGAGMRFFTKSESWDLKHLLSGYDWAALDRPGAIIVDVGGGQGGVARVLAGATRNLKIIVQDLPGTADKGQELLPVELKGRVEFMAHDFFTEQTVHSADVYFFRWILHNWSDKYCLRMLRALIPALKKGARVLVYEFVLPEGPETRWTKKQGLNLDMIMLADHNSCERTTADWEKLFTTADPRFKFLGVQQLEQSSMAIVEVEWAG